MDFLVLDLSQEKFAGGMNEVEVTGVLTGWGGDEGARECEQDAWVDGGVWSGSPCRRGPSPLSLSSPVIGGCQGRSEVGEGSEGQCSGERTQDLESDRPGSGSQLSP